MGKAWMSLSIEEVRGSLLLLIRGAPNMAQMAQEGMKYLAAQRLRGERTLMREWLCQEMISWKGMEVSRASAFESCGPSLGPVSSCQLPIWTLAMWSPTCSPALLPNIASSGFSCGQLCLV